MVSQEDDLSQPHRRCLRLLGVIRGGGILLALVIILVAALAYRPLLEHILAFASARHQGPGGVSAEGHAIIVKVLRKSLAASAAGGLALAAWSTAWLTLLRKSGRDYPPPPEPAAVTGTRWWTVAVCCFTLCAAAAAAPLLFNSLAMDEVETFLSYVRNSAILIARNVPAIGTYGNPNNHILFSLLAHLTTRLFGESEWALRAPSFFLGAAAIPALYALTLEVTRARWVAATAALIFAASPAVAFWMTQARGYTGLLLCVTLGQLFWVLGLRGDRRSWLGYVISTFCGAYFHPIALIPFVAQALYLMLAELRRYRGAPPDRLLPRGVASIAILAQVSAAIALAVFYTPAIPGLLLYTFGIEHRPPQDWMRFVESPPLSLLVKDSLRQINFYPFIDQPLMVVWTLAGLALSVVGVIRLFRLPGTAAPCTGMVFLLCIPALIAVRYDFANRYSLYILPGVCIALALGISSVADLARSPARVRGVVAALVFMVLVGEIWWHSTQSPLATGHPYQPYRETAAYLKAHMRQDDQVVFCAYDDPGLTYYFGRTMIKLDPTEAQQDINRPNAWLVFSLVDPASARAWAKRFSAAPGAVQIEGNFPMGVVPPAIARPTRALGSAADSETKS